MIKKTKEYVMDVKQLENLKGIATKIRIDTVSQICNAQSGHPGGALSIAEILAVLYFHKMKIDTSSPKWADRDRFVLSKGHASAAYYSVLAQRGFFNIADLKGFRKINGFLQGHPDMNKVPGVDMSSGSLGQGLSAANGMAIAGKTAKKDYHVYVLIGDGEIQEGQIWEAAMTAGHYKLDNVTTFLDNNNLQIDGPITSVMSPYPIREKFEAFGWHVIEADGHDIENLCDCIDKAEKIKGKPTLLLCKTIKGKGIEFMENKVKWHGCAFNEQEKEEALKELLAQL